MNNEFFQILTLIIIGLMFGVIFYQTFIPLLYKFKFGQSIRLEGPITHFKKSGTPTMGGLVIILITLFLWITTALFNNLLLKENILFFIILTISILGFSLIGFIDDYLIIKNKNNNGLSPKLKFLFQIVISIILYLLIIFKFKTNSINFFGTNINVSIFYPILIIICYVGISNATNLTDGIDGLLAGSSIISIVGIFILSVNEGNLFVKYFSLSIIIALFSFLLFNCPIAKVFMGDTGSLAIGVSIFSMLVILRMEILIIFFGFTYIIETISVILQVWFFKKTKGERIFKMTPIHHHFELSGISESIIDILFWLITFIMTAIGIILGVKLF